MQEKGDTGAKGDKGEKGDKGDKPAHRWIDTSLQIENPDGTWGDAVNLKGDKGDTGDQGIPGLDGKSLEFHWNGTQLGIRQEGDATFQYINLKGDKGDTGNTGKGLEFNWNGTQLGVRVEGDATYQYVNLKGEKGDPGESSWVNLGRFNSTPQVITYIVMNQLTSGNYVFEIPFGENPSYGFSKCIALVSLNEYYTPHRLMGTLYSADGLIYKFSLNPYTGQLNYVGMLNLDALMTDITDQFS